jgi:hypothetical protein
VVIPVSELISWNGVTPSRNRRDRLWEFSLWTLVLLADQGDTIRIVWSSKTRRVCCRVNESWFDMVPPWSEFFNGLEKWALRFFAGRRFSAFRPWLPRGSILFREWPVEVGILSWRLRGIVRLHALAHAGSIHLVLPNYSARVRTIAHDLIPTYQQAAFAIEQLELARILGC